MVKKRHITKNIVICNKKRKILYLSPSYSGSVHDKKIAQSENIEFQKIIRLLQDTGFQGFKPKNAIVSQPDKKPKGKELSPSQKDRNKQISKERVVVEHSISGFKTWRVCKDICRSWKPFTRDQFIFIACGLHNFRTKFRTG